MFCHNCGTKLPDDAMFCVSCGAKLAVAQAAEVVAAAPRAAPEVPQAAPEVPQAAPEAPMAAPEAPAADAARESDRRSEASAQRSSGFDDDDDFMPKRRQQAGGQAVAVAVIVVIAIAAIIGVVWYAKNSGEDGGAGGIGGGSAYSNTNKTEPLYDSRDGKAYRVVKIGGYTWMAENLNYQTGDSWCYDDNHSNCATHGRLYNWYAATGACPSGWRLPNNEDWYNLASAVGGGNVAGQKLKSKSGWDNDYRGNSSGNGTDEYGFSALSGGFRYRNHGSGPFGYTDFVSRWWSATESGYDIAYYLEMGSGSDLSLNNDTYKFYEGKVDGFSVRCIKN